MAFGSFPISWAFTNMSGGIVAGACDRRRMELAHRVADPGDRAVASRRGGRWYLVLGVTGRVLNSLPGPTAARVAREQTDDSSPVQSDRPDEAAV